jgi:outer membrane receptor for monomeric catechols
VDITSLVKDVTLKADFQYFNDAFNSFNFGVHYINHLYEPSQWLIDGSSFFDIRIGRRKAKELGVYISREQEFRNRFNVEYGLRYWLFSVSGEKDLFEIENIDEIPHEFYDLALHNAEEKLYTGFEPRFSLNYRLNTVSSIKLGYARNYQNVHMLSNSTSGTPLNVWHPSSSTVKPQRADQISLGYFRNFVNRRLELSGEVFYKDMRNQLDYKDGADFLLSSIFESELTAGRGWAYGVELLLKRETGRLNGWVGYTWSTSRRKFEEINGGNSFPALNDFTHDFAMVSIYNLSDKLIFSANWVYRTSAPVTIPYGNYMVDGKVLNAYTPRNAYRMPAYHRLDIGFTWRISRRSDLNITLYNAYGRKNAYAIVFDENQYNSLITEPMKLSLFSFVPSVSYQINF